MSAAAAALLAAAPARAEFWSGNDLLAHLTHTEAEQRLLGLGYVMGVFDTGSGVTHCPQNGRVTAGQLRDMTVQVLQAAPQLRDKTADVLLVAAFKTNWPCAQRGTGV